jgi:hypothetical protein
VESPSTLDTPKPVVMQGLGWATVIDEIPAVDMKAGGWGRAGPAHLIHHQEPGTQAGTRKWE